MSNERVVVKFTQSWRGYSKNERAGFDAAQAKALIDGKVAEQVKAVPVAAATTAPTGRAAGGNRGSGRKPAADAKPEATETPAPSTLPAAPNAGDKELPADETLSPDDDDEPKP